MTAVSRVDEGFPEESVFCTDLGGQLQIDGTGISPMPVDLLTDNPLGETLPSDEESIRVADGGQVTLSWTVADSNAVDHFRIYRSPDPNMISGDEELLADDVLAGDTSFVDDGSLTTDPSAQPLPPGSLGVWAVMDELVQPRFDAAATVVRTDPDHLYLYVAGGRDGPGNPNNTGINQTLASTEWAALSGDDTAPATGAYSYDLSQRFMTLALDVLVTFNLGSLKPYLGLGYGFYFLLAEVKAFDMTNEETQVRSGMQARAGLTYYLWKGGLFIEARYHYVGLEFLSTGDSDGSGITASAGYRFAF